MANTIKNYYNSVWVDISNYVDGVGEIPLISRNNDWTLRVETFTLEIAGSIQVDLAGGYDFEIDGKIKIEMDSTFLFTGYVSDSYFDYEQQKYILEITSGLGKLQNVFLGYVEMSNVFSTGGPTQFWIESTYPYYRCVQVLWALEKAFTVSGLTLDVPVAIKTTQLFTRVFQKTTPPYSGNKVITYADLFFDEYQLYSLGVAAAVQPSVPFTTNISRLIDGERIKLGRYNYIFPKGNHEPEVNCFEFVSEILTSLRFTVKAIGDYAFQLVTPNDNYVIADDDKFEYELKKNQKDLFDAGLSYTTPNINHISSSDYNAQRQLYYSATETKLSGIVSGGEDKISPMPNFSIFFNGPDTSYPLGSCTFSLSSNLIISDVSLSASLNMAALRYQARANNYNLETIITNAKTTFATIAKHQIDLQWNNSEIEQEI